MKINYTKDEQGIEELTVSSVTFFDTFILSVLLFIVLLGTPLVGVFLGIKKLYYYLKGVKLVSKLKRVFCSHVWGEWYEGKIGIDSWKYNHKCEKCKKAGGIIPPEPWPRANVTVVDQR